LGIVDFDSWVQGRKDEDRQDNDKDEQQSKAKSRATLLRRGAFMSQSVTFLSIVHVRLAYVKCGKDILQFEPLNQIERGGSECPVDDDPEFVEEWNGSVDLEGCAVKPFLGAREDLIDLRHGVAVADLQSADDEVDADEQVGDNEVGTLLEA
jgi:hypothetical protein